MTKRVVIKKGDVFCAVIDDEYKMYFQYIDDDQTDLNSRIIRVFKKRYAIDDNPNIEDIVKGEIAFHSHATIRWGIQAGLCEKVGNVKFNETVRLPFKTFNITVNIPGLTPHDWKVWYNNEPYTEITGPLPAEFLHADWGEVMPISGIVESMRTGKSPGFLARFDRILALNRSWEDKLNLLMKRYPWNDDV